MRTLITTLLAGAATAAILAPAASADTPLVSAPGARALAGAGGYLVWSAPAADGWRLTVRGPDGAVSQPAIAPFSRPVQARLGSSANFGPQRRLIAVYARAGDVYSLDLRAGTETRIARLSTRANETAAAVSGGQYVVVRSGGMRRGVYAYSRSGRGRRLTTTVPADVAMSPTRVATIEGSGTARKVVIRRLSGRGGPVVAARGVATASSLWLTRYRVGWATSDPQRGTQLFATRRFAGSGGPFTISVRRSPWTSASPLYGIATERHAEPGFYLDDSGVQRFSDPRPFHGVS